MAHKLSALVTVLLFVGVLIPVFPVAADAPLTVYAESGRFSLDVPSDWTTRDLPPLISNRQFPSETILAASRTTVVETSSNQVIVHGPLIEVTVIPLDLYRSFWTADRSHYEIDGKSDHDLLKIHFEVQLPETEPEFLEIDGHTAAQVLVPPSEPIVYWIGDLRAQLFVEQYVQQTVVLADRLLYVITSTGPDLDVLKAIAATLHIYDTSPIYERPPLSLNGGAFSLGIHPGWLVAAWGSGTPMGNYFIGGTQHYYVILPEASGEMLQILYLRQLGIDMHSVNLPGLYIQIGVHPYDTVFGSADVVVDHDKLLSAFSRLATSYSPNLKNLEPTAATINGTPVLTADLNRVYNGHNQGSLTLIDSSYHLYSLLIVGPEEYWQPDYVPIVEQLLASLDVIPPTASEDVPIGLQVGLRAPDFSSLHTLAFESVLLSDFRGRIVLLNFWDMGRGCGGCVDQIPYLQEVHETRDDVVILTILHGDSPSDLQTWVYEHGITFPVAFDTSRDVIDQYQIWTYPTTIIIDRTGRIRAIYIQPATSIREINQWIHAAENE